MISHCQIILLRFLQLACTLAIFHNVLFVMEKMASSYKPIVVIFAKLFGSVIAIMFDDFSSNFHTTSIQDVLK